MTGAVGTQNRAWAKARENVEKEKLEAETRGTNRVAGVLNTRDGTG